MALTHGHCPENWPISPVWLGRNGILFAKGSEQRVALGCRQSAPVYDLKPCQVAFAWLED